MAARPILNQIDLKFTLTGGGLLGYRIGKSTIVNLLPRVLRPDHGRILIDGVDIRKVTPSPCAARSGP